MWREDQAVSVAQNSSPRVSAIIMFAIQKSCSEEVRSFLDQLDGYKQFFELFDHLEGVTFFMKNRQGRFVAFGSGTKRCLDFGSADQLLGLSDYDLYPKHVAQRIYEDDQRVYKSGQPLLNIVELLVNPRHAVIGWYITNKFPVRNKQGEIIGVMGTVQPYEGRRKSLLQGSPLDDVIEHIRSNPAANHSLSELAEKANLSVRQLGRKFQEILGMSPRDFIISCRMAYACSQLAHSHASVADIALQCGFYDQSALAHQFRRTFGMSPQTYRKRYVGSSVANLESNSADL